MDAVTLIRASKESFRMFRLFNRCQDLVHAYGIEIQQWTDSLIGTYSLPDPTHTSLAPKNDVRTLSSIEVIQATQNQSDYLIKVIQAR